MGTSAFAVPILERLMSSNFNIVGIVCQPNRKRGRGLKIQPCAIRALAEDYNIRLLQPETLKNNEIIKQIKDLNPDLIIVASYGLFIPQEILKIPSRGCLNIHPSLLPHYRGPSPIQQALLNGDQETGVSLMVLDEEMDHGPLVAQHSLKIALDDNQITLRQKLSILGADLLVQNLLPYFEGKIRPFAQDHQRASFTKLLKKLDGKVDWSRGAREIERQIRAFVGWPGSFALWEKKRIIILATEVLDGDRYRENNGEVFNINSEICVQCGQNILKIKKLRLEGKKEVTGEEFLRGYPKIIGAVLHS